MSDQMVDGKERRAPPIAVSLSPIAPPSYPTISLNDRGPRPHGPAMKNFAIAAALAALLQLPGRASAQALGDPVTLNSGYAGDFPEAFDACFIPAGNTYMVVFHSYLSFINQTGIFAT